MVRLLTVLFFGAARKQLIKHVVITFILIQVHYTWLEKNVKIKDQLMKSLSFTIWLINNHISKTGKWMSTFDVDLKE